MFGLCIDMDEMDVRRYSECVRAGVCSHVAAQCSTSTNPRFPIRCITFHQAEQACVFEGKRLRAQEEWRSLPVALD